MLGYNGRILEVNLSNRKIGISRLDEKNAEITLVEVVWQLKLFIMKPHQRLTL